MATGKRFYWIKLYDSFFNGENKHAIDFLMSQKNGANYVILYQMLCLMTANTGGVMASSVGEMLIPYDPAKIQRDCRWFSIDTVVVALELYKKLGWIYEQVDGILRIGDIESIVGSETEYAVQKKQQRLGKGVDNVHTNVHGNVHTENRDKSLEFRNKSLDNRDQSLDGSKTTTTTTFSSQDAGAGAPVHEEKESVGQREGIPPPSVTQVYAYMRGELCEDVKANEAEKFVAWNEKFGWDCLPNWQGAARLWCARRAERGRL